MKLRIFLFVGIVILPIMRTTFETTQYLCMSSSLFAVSSAILFYLERYVISFLMGILCLTSINHWRDYQLGGWRQRIDMAWVNVCGLYGVLEVLQGTEIQRMIFFNMMACVALFYRISQQEGPQWSIFHMSIHLYAAFFIPLLYLI